jgi:hypothetical protein
LQLSRKSSFRGIHAPLLQLFSRFARQTVARGLSWLYLQRNNSHRSTSSGHPVPPIGAFRNVHEIRTLWQF